MAGSKRGVQFLAKLFIGGLNQNCPVGKNDGGNPNSTRQFFNKRKCFAILSDVDLDMLIILTGEKGPGSAAVGAPGG